MNRGFEKKRKIIAVVLILVAVVIIIVMAVSILGKTKNTTNSGATSEEINVYTSEKAATGERVENVILEKSKIVYENGTSKITTKVTNNGAAIENLRFTVKFIATDGSVIAKALGHVGAIKENETKYIDSSVTADVSNAKKIIYGIKK